MSKKRSAISSIQTEGLEVTVVSPVVPGGTGLDTYSSQVFHDDEHDVEVLVPPTANVFGITVVNHVITIILTLLYSITIYQKYEGGTSVSYNFRPENALPGLIGKHGFGFPYVIQYEDGLFVHRSALRRITAKLTKRLCNGSLDGGICTNTNLAAVLDTENTAIVRGFPSIGMPDTLPNPEYEEPDRTVVMFAGHFDTVRGIDLFLDVVPQIDNENVEFWISGTGRDEEKERIRNRVNRINDNRITYFGTLPWEEYRTRVVSADVLVNFQSPEMPISTYTFPSKLLDFMSAGSIIVSTDMSDLRSELSDELIIGGRTEQDITSSLDSTIDRCKTGNLDVGERARAWVTTHCTHEYAGEQFGNVIERAMAK
ncbi:glycosyltransferase [Haloarchaeobius salinus]|uniref:glycosyltransferase n=1 Tax=Haloarchaeobius salinus TaxID=1198298 RepID=UPI002109E332|nr:glycosyltransferase [Haloarchaeobius salinus]